MPGAVPRTSTWALTNVTIRYAATIADAGLEKAARADRALARGLNTYRGRVAYEPVARAHGLEHVPVEQLIGS
jgi:alanine dehydrogenase